MIARSLIALCLLVLLAQGRLVSVGDNEKYERSTFASMVKLNDVKAG